MQHDPFPKMLDEAVTVLIDEMSEENKEKIRNMTSRDLWSLHFSYGMYVRNRLGLWDGNKDLYDDLGMRVAIADSASEIIVREVWRRLSDT